MIDIVIVNWNSGVQLEECVESVRAYGSGLVGRCIVVDNGSVDGSADFLDATGDVDLVRTGANLGFAKACNIGAASGEADLILFLNPDARLLEQSLTGATEFLNAPGNEGAGIVGVQLIGDDGSVQRTCARFPTPLRFIARSLGLHVVFKQLDTHMSDWLHNQIRQVDHVIGAFFLMRRSLFQKLGGFDERFFVYLEDLDLSFRASAAGFQSWYLAQVQAFHKGGGVSEQVKAHRLFYSLRSRILYAFKHFSRRAALLVALSTLTIELATRVVFLCLGQRWREVPDVLRGYGMLWRWALSRLAGARA